MNERQRLAPRLIGALFFLLAAWGLWTALHRPPSGHPAPGPRGVPPRGASPAPRTPANEPRAPPSAPVDPSLVPLAWGHQPGDLLVYRFGYEFRLQMKADPRAFGGEPGSAVEPPPFAIHADGGLAQRCYAAGPEGYTLGLTFAPLTLRFHAEAGAGAGDARLAEGAEAFAGRLGQELYVRTDRLGQTLAVAFSPQADAEARNFLRSWLAALRLVLSEEPRASWSATEEDSTGSYHAHYARATAEPTPRHPLVRLERRKAYLAVFLGAGPGTETGLVDLAASGVEAEARGEAVAHFDPRAGRLEALDCAEGLRVAGRDARVPLDATTDWNLSLLLGEARREDTSAARFVEAAARARSALAGEGGWLASASLLPEPTPMPGGPGGVDGPREGEDLQSLLSGLDLAARQGRLVEEAPRVFFALRRVLAADPSAVEGAVRAARSGAYLDETVAVLLDALGETGGAAAEEALLALAASESLGEPLRASALLALANLPAPSEDALRLLETTADSAAPLLAERSVNALGAIAGRLADKVRSDRLAAALEARLGVDDPRRRTAILDALGNAGRPRSVDVLLEAARSEDEDTRVAGLYALRSQPGERAEGTLVAAVRADPSMDARRAAVQALGQRGGAAALVALREAAALDRSPAVRVEAVQGLAPSAASDAESRRVLEQAATTDPDEGVRDAARSVLEGGEHR